MVNRKRAYSMIVCALPWFGEVFSTASQPYDVVSIVVLAGVGALTAAAPEANTSVVVAIVMAIAPHTLAFLAEKTICSGTCCKASLCCSACFTSCRKIINAELKKLLGC